MSLIQIPMPDPTTGKRNWKGKKKIHDWAYVGVNKETNEELGQCQICQKIQAYGEKGERPVTKRELAKMRKEGKIEIR